MINTKPMEVRIGKLQQLSAEYRRAAARASQELQALQNDFPEAEDVPQWIGDIRRLENLIDAYRDLQKRADLEAEREDQRLRSAYEGAAMDQFGELLLERNQLKDSLASGGWNADPTGAEKRRLAEIERHLRLRKMGLA